MDGAFRKIDIDHYDEDRLLEEELYPPYPLAAPQALQRAREVEKEVRGLLQRGDGAGALALVLAEPPYGPQPIEAKAIATATLLSIVLSTKATDVAGLVTHLTPVQQDTLMKYIYKGMQDPSDGAHGSSTCGALLMWHERLVQIAGTGAIVRVLTDHRRV